MVVWAGAKIFFLAMWMLGDLIGHNQLLGASSPPWTPNSGLTITPTAAGWWTTFAGGSYARFM